MNADDRSAEAANGLAAEHEEQRKHPRTKEFGSQQLLVCPYGAGNSEIIHAVLWDFSDGGLGMESPEPLTPEGEVTISGELHGPLYSVAFRARARVAYCRSVTDENYRIGVEFREVSYRRLAGDTA